MFVFVLGLADVGDSTGDTRRFATEDNDETAPEGSAYARSQSDDNATRPQQQRPAPPPQQSEPRWAAEKASCSTTVQGRKLATFRQRTASG